VLSLVGIALACGVTAKLFAQQIPASSTDLPHRVEALEKAVHELTQRIAVLEKARVVQKEVRPIAPVPGTSAIESTIEGEFEGWDGDTIFKLDNGQIWQQAKYDYMYEYAYRPDATIYHTTGGWKKKAGGPPFSVASSFMGDAERSLIPGASPRAFTPLSWYDCRKGRRLPLGLSARANETR
jgi:hypothetical protein